MPAPFTPRERERIAAVLKASGRRLFATSGLRKTSLADLVADAGIVKSTFYAFFPSKEALYLELLLEQAHTTRRLTVEQGLHAADTTLGALRAFLRAAVGILTEDPLYRRLVTHPDELALVVSQLPPDAVPDDAAVAGFLSELTEFIAQRQRAGEIVGADPAVVVGALRAVLLLPLHAAEFGDAYPAVLDLTIDAVTAGLVTAGHRAPA